MQCNDFLKLTFFYFVSQHDVCCRQSLTIPLERLEGQATPGEEDESRDTVSENLDMDFTTSVKKLPVIYPKGRERLSD